MTRQIFYCKLAQKKVQKKGMDETTKIAISKGWVQIVHTLSVKTEGGTQKMNCANTEGK